MGQFGILFASSGTNLSAPDSEDQRVSIARELLIRSKSAAKILQTTVRKFAYKAQQYGIDYRHYR